MLPNAQTLSAAPKWRPVYQQAVPSYAPYSPSEFQVIVIATQWDDRLGFLLKSCPYHLTVLGLGLEWRGLRTKFDILYEWFASKEMVKPRILMYVDTDTLFNAGCPHNLVKTFLATGADIIFAAETMCWPDADKAAAHPQSPTQHRFLNSGTYIGFTKSIWCYMKRKPKSNLLENDQRFWTHKFLRQDAAAGDPRIVLDYHTDFFTPINDYSKDSFSVKENGLHNDLLDNRVCVLHGNGPPVSKDLLYSIRSAFPFVFEAGSPVYEGMAYDGPVNVSRFGNV